MNLVSTAIRYSTFILAIAGVIVMTSVMQTIHGQDNASIPPPPVTPPVKPYSGGVAATGIIEALSENVAIGVPAPGIISEVKVRVWDKVKKDDVLLVIDDRELRAALGKQNAAIAVSQANLDVSLAQLNKARATLDRLREGVELGRAELRLAPDEAEQETKVAHAIHDEGLLGGLGRGGALEVVIDQQPRAEADQLPEDEEHQQRIREHDAEHREHEDREPAKVPGAIRVLVHIAE